MKVSQIAASLVILPILDFSIETGPIATMNASPPLRRPVQRNMPYRLSAGIMLFNARGEIWIGRRRPRWFAPTQAPVWQMPQGGLSRDELPVEAAYRELFEETGASSVALAATHNNWLSYDLPEHLLGVALKGKYRGQRQLWFAMRFLGADDEFDISAHKPERPEFDAWRWARPADAIAQVVPWRRKIYEEVFAEFRHLIESRD